MDHQYGIAVTNKFSFLIDDEEDPLENLKQKEEEAKNLKKDDKKAKTKSGKKPATPDIKPKQPEPPVAKKEAEKPVQPPRVNERERGGGRGGRGRGELRETGRGELRENDGSRPPRRPVPRENRESFKGDENVPPEFRDRGDGSNRRERGEGGFERGRGRGGSRGRGRGRGGPRPESGRGGFGGSGERRREFDRHSGTDKTGVKPVDKRDGSGAHNWGSYKDDVEEQTQPQTSADESGEWAAPQVEQTENAEPNESGEAVAPKEEEENKEMTLDEWKALQDQKRMKSSFNIRKAGEGVDNAQWKKGIAYNKKKEEEEDEEESEDEEEDEDRHGHRKQIVTDIRITFADNPRRGGRGGRGGRGRGGPRGEGRGGSRGGGSGRGGFGGPGERAPRGTREAAAPRMDDETDFPRLVKSEA